MSSAVPQSTVAFLQGFGVPGEIYANQAVRAQSYQLQSALASYNVFGRAFTKVSQGVAQAGNPAGTAVFAGILANPKTSALIGDGSNPLNPALVLPNYAQADIMSEGSIIVTLGAAAAIGDVVIYDNTTGVLATIAPGVALPAGKSYAFANVDYYTISAAGLAVITLTPSTAAVVQ